MKSVVPGLSITGSFASAPDKESYFGHSTQGIGRRRSRADIELARTGEAARERIAAEHTNAVRAAHFEAVVAAAVSAPSARRESAVPAVAPAGSGSPRGRGAAGRTAGN